MRNEYEKGLAVGIHHIRPLGRMRALDPVGEHAGGREALRE
ncbi:hypothetical protein [Bacillus marinisedimentorum]|nr:hypothetical protein [Bacillus marinisedimentorum]